ncbi:MULTISPECIES: hypothetical protein [unclassified Sphingomonas]|uniref:hypothetical protein n=1 Tax=unclassified Sphingomonas TaxID=196159 RepID=UPI000B2CC954|nr:MULTISPECIES: hypothetical protein [unclassified Sphingomonas]
MDESLVLVSVIVPKHASLLNFARASSSRLGYWSDRLTVERADQVVATHDERAQPSSTGISANQRIRTLETDEGMADAEALAGRFRPQGD